MHLVALSIAACPTMLHTGLHIFKGNPASFTRTLYGTAMVIDHHSAIRRRSSALLKAEADKRLIATAVIVC